MSLCDLCEDQPALIKCASCKGIGTGEKFCIECCEQLHSAAKTRGHALTDMEGKPRTAGGAAAAAGSAVVAAVSTPAKPASSTAAGGTVAVAKIPLCSLCDDVEATVQCTNCKNAAYCADCNTDFHMPAKQAGHTQLRFVIAGASTADSDALPTTASIVSPLLPLQRTMSGTPASKPPSPLLRSSSNLLRSPMLSSSPSAATPTQPATPGSLPRNSLALIASATPGSASTRPRGMSLAMFARPGSAGLNSPLSPSLGAMGSSTTGGSFSKPFSLVGASAIKSPPSPSLGSSSSSHNLLPGVASIRSLAALERLPSIDAAVPATSDEAKQCALCELDLATFRCDACDESYCDECNELSHTTAAKMAHTRTKISSAPSPTANAPLFPTPPPTVAPSAAAAVTATPAAKEAVAVPAAAAAASSKAPLVVSASMTTLAAPSAGALLPTTPPRSGSPSPAGSRRGSRRGSLKRPPGISTTLFAAPANAAISSAVKPAVPVLAAATTVAAKPAPAAVAPAPVAATPASMCSVCEDEAATVRCPDCKEDLCAGCDKQMHMPAKLAGHVRSAIGQAAPTQTAATAAALLAAAPTASRPSISVAAPAAAAPVPSAVVKPADVAAPAAITKPAVTAAPVVAAAKPPATVVAPLAAAAKPAAAVVAAPAAAAKPAKVVMCDMCDDLVSAFKCDECEMALCADCDLSLHKPVKQSTHQRIPMSAVPAPTPAPVKPIAIVAPIAVVSIKPAIVTPTPAVAAVVTKPPAAVLAPVTAAKPPIVVPAPAAAKPATVLPAVVPAVVVPPLKLATIAPAVVAAPSPTSAKPTTTAIVSPPPSAAPASMCSVCEDEPATVRCPDCKEDLCAGCDKQMHAPAKLAGHMRAPIGQAAPTQTAVPAPLPTPAPKVDPVPLKSPLLPSPPIAAAPTMTVAPLKVASPRSAVPPPATLVLQPSKPSTPTLVLSPRGQPSPKVTADRAAFDKQLITGTTESSRPPSVIPPPIDVTPRPASTTTAPPSQTSTRASSIAHRASTAAASSVVSSSAASSGLESDAAPDPMDNADDFDLEFDIGDLDGSDPFEIETLESLPASRHSPATVPVAVVTASAPSAATVTSSPTTSAAASAAQSQAQRSDRVTREKDRSRSSSRKRDRERDRDRDGSRRSHGDRSHSRNGSRGESRSGESRSHRSDQQQQPADDFVPRGPLHRHYSVNSEHDGSDRELPRGRDRGDSRRREDEDDFEEDSRRFLHARPSSSQQGSSSPGVYRENHTPTPPAFASPRKSSLKSPSSTPRGRTADEGGRDSRASDRALPRTPGSSSRQGFRDEFSHEADLYSTAFERSSRIRRESRDRDRITHRHHRSRSRLGSSSGDRAISPVSAVGEELTETVSALVGSNHQAASLLQQLLSVLHRPDGHEGDVAHPATALMQIAQMATTAALDLDPHHAQQQFEDHMMHSPRLMQHRPGRLQDPQQQSQVSLHRNSSSRSSILSPRKLQQQPYSTSTLHRKALSSRSSRLLLREGTPISADQASLNEAWLARKLRERLASSQQHAREGLLVPAPTAAAVYAPLTPQPPSQAHSFQAQWGPQRPGSAQAFTARPSTTPSAFAAAFPASGPPLQAQMYYSPPAAAAASNHPHAYAWAPVQPMHSAAASPFVPSPPQSAPPLSAAATASLLASPAATAAVFASLMPRSPDGSPLPLPVASSAHQHALAVAAATAAYHAARQTTMQQMALHATASSPPPLSYSSSPFPPPLSSPSPHPSPMPVHSPLASSVHLTYASPSAP